MSRTNLKPCERWLGIQDGKKILWVRAPDIFMVSCERGCVETYAPPPSIRAFKPGDDHDLTFLSGTKEQLSIVLRKTKERKKYYATIWRWLYGRNKFRGTIRADLISVTESFGRRKAMPK